MCIDFIVGFYDSFLKAKIMVQLPEISWLLSHMKRFDSSTEKAPVKLKVLLHVEKKVKSYSPR